MSERVAKPLPEWVNENIEAVRNAEQETSEFLSPYAEALMETFISRRRFGALTDLCGLMIEALDKRLVEESEEEEQKESVPETCGNCRYWKWGGIENEERTSGDCRCDRPCVTSAMRLRQWPVTFRGDWCGDYEEIQS